MLSGITNIYAQYYERMKMAPIPKEEVYEEESITNIDAQDLFPEALKCFKRGVFILQGGVISLDEYEKAAAEFRKVLQYNPDYPKALYNLALIYTGISKVDGCYYAFYKAENYYKRYLKTNPEDYNEVDMALLQLNLARDSVEKEKKLSVDDYKRAIGEVERELQYDSVYAETCYKLAFIYKEIFEKQPNSHSYIDAEEYYKKYLATNPENKEDAENELIKLELLREKLGIRYLTREEIIREKEEVIRKQEEVIREKLAKVKAQEKEEEELAKERWARIRTSYFSYTFLPSAVENASSMHGLTLSYLFNGRLGRYISFRANTPFFRQKIKLSTEKNNMDYAVISNPDSCISSAEIAFGITKKIYRPVFFTVGIGAGMNTLSRKHEVFTTDSSYVQWLYTNENRSFYLVPEVGLNIAFRHFVLSGNAHYRIPITNSTDITYKNNLSFSVGVGFSSRHLFDYYDGAFIVYNFDIPPVPYFNFFSNSSLIGLTVGSFHLLTHYCGIYGSVRLNPLFILPDKRKNADEKGNLFTTLGFNFDLFYFGGGIAYQKSENNNKIRFNPELGINIPVGNILLRSGINVPAFDFRSGNMYYSLGVGYIIRYD
jgi:tetratricopeptide (TPR) repeat protein